MKTQTFSITLSLSITKIQNTTLSINRVTDVSGETDLHPKGCERCPHLQRMKSNIEEGISQQSSHEGHSIQDLKRTFVSSLLDANAEKLNLVPPDG